MKVLAVALTIFSCLVLGAHFLRAGHVVVTAACVALPLLLLARRRWAVRALQVALVIGAGIWVWTTVALLHAYLQEGRALVHLILTPAILGTVALIALLAARLLERLLPAPPGPDAPSEMRLAA